MPARKVRQTSHTELFLRIGVVFLLTLLTCSAITFAFLLKTKELSIENAFSGSLNKTAAQTETDIEPFPISVNPAKQSITENPLVTPYYENNFSHLRKERSKDDWLAYIRTRLSRMDWYQNLASPASRILVIEPGERKEQVIDNFGDILRWDTAERTRFETLITSTAPELSEGKFFPGTYVVMKNATPDEVAGMLNNFFREQILDRYTEDVKRLVPLQDALTIASLLEREAYSFEDMRAISGVIWNRLFDDMLLQIDASLQYAKASKGGRLWWPQVAPDDKYIKSPFNTYDHKGLPPSPIANPSTEAILAALNPLATDCMFYFHDTEGDFYCSKTYEEHVAKLVDLYGQGR